MFFNHCYTSCILFAPYPTNICSLFSNLAILSHLFSPDSIFKYPSILCFLSIYICCIYTLLFHPIFLLRFFLPSSNFLVPHLFPLLLSISIPYLKKKHSLFFSILLNFFLISLLVFISSQHVVKSVSLSSAFFSKSMAFSFLPVS